MPSLLVPNSPIPSPSPIPDPDTDDDPDDKPGPGPDPDRDPGTGTDPGTGPPQALAARVAAADTATNEKLALTSGSNELVAGLGARVATLEAAPYSWP